MPNTPASRPDVAGIKARAKKMLEYAHFWEGPAWSRQLVKEDIPALIAYIGRLEAVVEAAREWRQSLEGDGWAKDVIEHGAARPGMGDGDG